MMTTGRLNLRVRYVDSGRGQVAAWFADSVRLVAQGIMEKKIKENVAGAAIVFPYKKFSSKRGVHL